MNLMAMLSIRDGWDHYLLILVCVYGLWVCGSILWEEYGPNFNHKKGGGEDSQKPSEANNATGGNLGKLGGSDINLGLAVGNTDRLRVRNILCRFRKRIAVVVNQLLKFFGFVHSAGQQPNSAKTGKSTERMRHERD
jgi:hypothetical protein